MGPIAQALVLVTRGEDETRAVAARLGRRARGGEVVLLSGPLGSGKTTFAQGFVRGAGARGWAASPTFAIVREHRGRVLVRHMDLFRVRPGDLAELGLEEALEDPGAACLVEWPDAARAILPGDRLEVAFRHAARGRRLSLRALGPRSERLLAALR